MKVDVWKHRNQSGFFYYAIMNTGQIQKARINDKFTTIPNEILQSKDLSFGAKGLLGFLLSLPIDWVLYKTGLPKLCKEKYHTIDKYFRELVDAGFILAVEIRNEKMQFKGFNYIVYSEPICEIPKSVLPKSVNQQLTKETNTDKETEITMPSVNEEFETLWKEYKANALANVGSKAKAKKAFERQSKSTQALILEQIKFYVFECCASGSYNSHLSTYINGKYYANEYFSHEVLPFLDKINPEEISKLKRLFPDSSVPQLKAFLAYLEARQSTKEFKDYINSYFTSVEQNGLKVASFEVVCGTYAKQYKDGRFFKSITT